MSELIKRIEAWLEAQRAELYNEIEEIESSDEPDVLAPDMTEVELLEIRIEIYDEVASTIRALAK